ncbi:MAG: glycosyltransferase [Sulfuricaulis sp.]
MKNRAEQIRDHFDMLSGHIGKWRQRNKYYHDDQIKYFRYLVGENKRVLELGSGTGELLNALKPSYGVGIDISPTTIKIARAKYPNLTFLAGDVDNLDFLPDECFDYIILSDLVGYLEDVQACLEGLQRFCAPHTRIVISSYNFLWEPILKIGEMLHLKMPTPDQSWLSLNDLCNLLTLSDLQVVKTEHRLLFPKFVPVFSWILNRLGTLPMINKACISHYIVARPLGKSMILDMSTTIVIPCRNEKGNIRNAMERIPRFGKQQEILFIDGHSADGTPDEIKRLIPLYPDKDIKLLIQTGTGKGNAVHEGFQAAQGDILMILDADLTVPPEDLPKFYRAIASGKAEVLNGCRLIYPLEDEAMRLLNLFANKLFAMIFTWLLGQRIKDTLCGTKVILKKDYQKIIENRKYFGDIDPFGDFDLLFGASKQNLKIIDIPVRYQHRAYGETQIRRFRHGFLLVKMVIYAITKIKWI